MNGFYIIVALDRMRSSTLFSCLFNYRSREREREQDLLDLFRDFYFFLSMKLKRKEKIRIRSQKSSHKNYFLISLSPSLENLYLVQTCVL